jgi:uncharacterized protein (TIGR03437 family)
MCLKVTAPSILRLTALIALAGGVSAQTAGGPVLDWRRIGNSAVLLALPGVASGPVERVWYSEDGARLFARTHSGKVFETADFEQWRAAPDTAPPEQNLAVPLIPEADVKVRPASSAGRLYGLGRFAWRSEDGGSTWSNLTNYRGFSILGDGLADLAASPRDAEELVVAAGTGVWRSADGGLSWTSLNQFFPNLPVRRLYALPAGAQGVRIGADLSGAAEVEWAPGEKAAWRPSDNADAEHELAQRRGFSLTLRTAVTAAAVSGVTAYAGGGEGQLWYSSDHGATWLASPVVADTGAIETIYVDPKDARIAIAVAGARAGKSARVLRTINGGLFWDDIGAGLPEGAAHGVTADRASGAIYVATDAGVFFTQTDLASAGRPSAWTSLAESLPKAPAMDVKLDAGANQLFVALDGYGVYAAIAPHRFRDVRVVNAADYSSRPAAPGSLLSVLGVRVRNAQIANIAAPVLAATDSASQIQVPFQAKGASVSLAIEAAGGKLTLGLPLQNVSPAIFIDPDGTPLILDADSGVLLDTSRPARSQSRLQILTTGLGRVKPEWPAGVAAPLTDPPRVGAALRVYLDRRPLEVTQATLAPGYVGFYLVEVQLPSIVNAGPAELYVEAEGQQSNRVRLFIEP